MANGEADAPPGLSRQRSRPETTDIATYLAAYNRGGYLTSQSQPGLIDESWRQRAAVEGWTEPWLADELERECGSYGLWVKLHPPGGRSREPGFVVTEVDGKAHTSFGGRLRKRDLRRLWRGSTILPDVAVDMTQVAIVDPKWGRNDLLWDAVGEALRTAGTPEPSGTTSARSTRPS